MGPPIRDVRVKGRLEAAAYQRAVADRLAEDFVRWRDEEYDRVREVPAWARLPLPEDADATLGLLPSLPRIDESGEEALVPITGAPPSLLHVPPGCPFHPRCPYARVPGVCSEEIPALREVRPEHRSAWHFAVELADVDLSEIRRASAPS